MVSKPSEYRGSAVAESACRMASGATFPPFGVKVKRGLKVTLFVPSRNTLRPCMAGVWSVILIAATVRAPGASTMSVFTAGFLRKSTIKVGWMVKSRSSPDCAACCSALSGPFSISCGIAFPSITTCGIGGYQPLPVTDSICNVSLRQVSNDARCHGAAASASSAMRTISAWSFAMRRWSAGLSTVISGGNG